MLDKIQTVVGILLGLRKFLVMAGLMGLGVLFRVKGLISGDNFVDLLKGTSIAFFASNSVEHIKKAITSYVDSKGNKKENVDVSVGDLDAK